MTNANGEKMFETIREAAMKKYKKIQNKSEIS